jgi:hypothetical protein
VSTWRAWIWPVVVAVAVAVAMLVAGCGSGAKQAACNPLPRAGTAEQTATGRHELAFLTDVGAVGDDCVDRVTFDFRARGGGRPGYRVHYLPARQALVEDGSGRPVKVDGSAFLVVRFEPAATAEASGDQLTLTYTGSRRLRPSKGRFVNEIVKTGDFEAVVTWVIALDEKRPFRAVAAPSAPQLIVEIG